MKFILLLVLVMPNGTSSMATAEFDDLDACRNASVLAREQTPPQARLEAKCYPKSAAPKK
jgi:hypothetical protein